MPSASQKDMDELLNGSERHMCPTLQDHWTMITVKDGSVTIWNNAFGNPEGPAERLTPMIFDLRYCPFCGQLLGEPDEVTQAVIDIVELALVGEDNQNYQNYRPEELKELQKLMGGFSSGQIQITVLDPNLKVSSPH